MDAGLTRRQQLNAAAALAREALREWGMEDRPLKVIHHFHNTTYKVGSDHVLRLSRPGYQTDEALRSEVRFLEYLAEEGLHVPRPVRTKSGEERAAVGDTRAVLFPWISARFAQNSFREVHARRQGVEAARLHEASLAFKPGKGFTRLTVSPDTFLAGKAGDDADRTTREELVAHLRRPQLRILDESAEMIRNAWRKLDEPTLIHTDITPWNTMFLDGEAYIIDFDDMGFGPLEYDLGVVRCEYLDLPDPEPLWSAFLEGYAAERPVPEALEANLDAVVAARHLLFAVWLVGNIDHPAFPEAPTWIDARIEALEEILKRSDPARVVEGIPG